MTIDNVTPEKFAAAKAELAKQSVTTVGNSTLDGNEGVIYGHGVTANYAYIPATETLSVIVIHKPFYIPASAIEHQITTYFDSPAPEATEKEAA